MIRDIEDFIEQDRITTLLRNSPRIEIVYGWYISTGDSRMIEDNLREDGIEADDLGWDFISEQVDLIERNMLTVCHAAGLRLHNEGHDDSGDLIGTGYFATKDSEWSDVANSFDLLRHIVEHEPVSTGRGDIQAWLATTDEALFKDVDPRVASACDVSFGIFDDAALKRFFEAVEAGSLAQFHVEESFLAPPEPPGIFRKIINGVEIFSARCPGCKRIHGTFTTYDQAAGNRQCKFCTRDYVDKMMKVSQTGNFKHLLKKDHEARASKRYR